jgi:hypothetical protein
MNIVRLAAAGAGKTWRICNDAISVAHKNPEKHILMVSYTNKGIESIKNELENQNNGLVPANVIVLTWYQFLLRELIKPYQTYIYDVNEIKSLDFSLQHKVNYAKGKTKERYITKSNNVRAETASELVLFINGESGNMVFDRLEKIYSIILFDEVQDLAGHDIDILEKLFGSNIDIVCVGDNKQATFQTHTTRTNNSKTGKNVFVFFNELAKKGNIKVEESLCSRRFNADICAFANCVYPDGKNMSSGMKETTEHDGVFIISKADAIKYYMYFHPQELRYSIETTDICGPFAVNFGACKGKTYDRCMIYCNKTFTKFLKGTELKSPEKYYVAVTRARYSNALVVDKLFGANGFEKCRINLGECEIEAERFVNGW